MKGSLLYFFPDTPKNKRQKGADNSGPSTLSKLAQVPSAASTPDWPLKLSLELHKSDFQHSTTVFASTTYEWVGQQTSRWKSVYETSHRQIRNCEWMSLATSKYGCVAYTTMSGDKKNSKVKCVPIMDEVRKNNEVILGGDEIISEILGATPVVHWWTSIVGWHCI